MNSRPAWAWSTMHHTHTRSSCSQAAFVVAARPWAMSQVSKELEGEGEGVEGVVSASC